MSTPQLPAVIPEPPQPPAPPRHDADARWKFIRDVAAFELKLALNNLHNFIQIPLTLAVAVYDVIFTEKDKEEGSRFYKLVEYGRTIDDAIDIYSIVSDRERSMNKTYTVDTLLSRIEGVIVKEYAKGGTAANIKAAVDRAIDEMQSKGGPIGSKADEAFRQAAEKMRDAMSTNKPGNSG